jgi:hypothetical protein
MVQTYKLAELQGRRMGNQRRKRSGLSETCKSQNKLKDWDKPLKTKREYTSRRGEREGFEETQGTRVRGEQDQFGGGRRHGASVRSACEGVAGRSVGEQRDGGYEEAGPDSKKENKRKEN